MKKRILPLSMLIMMLLLSGCNKDQKKPNTDDVTPTKAPEVTTPAEEITEEPKEEGPAEVYSLQDYYPFLADTEYSYEGSGMEYASYIRVTDYLEEGNQRIQTRSNNGGTETVRVLEIKDGKLTVINMINESYYRENIINKETDMQEDILLMEPLVQGTEWTLDDGRKRYISAVDVDIDTPFGGFKALEVTTEGEDYQMKDYYAPQVGLVKSIFTATDMEVVSVLKGIKSDTPFTQTIDVYYPDVDEKLYVVPLTLTFWTNDETKTVLQEAISKELAKESFLPLTSVNTKINSLSLNDDGIVHIDFSSEFVTDMQVGAGYEGLTLQGITNTLGNYYGVLEVLITVEGKPYESGHILMNEGETFKVNMDRVSFSH